MPVSPEEQILIEWKEEVTKATENALRKFFEKSFHSGGVLTGMPYPAPNEVIVPRGTRVDATINMATGETKVTPVPTPDMTGVNAQLARYERALRNIVDFHPPGSATHKHALNALKEPE